MDTTVNFGLDQVRSILRVIYAALHGSKTTLTTDEVGEAAHLNKERRR